MREKCDKVLKKQQQKNVFSLFKGRSVSPVSLYFLNEGHINLLFRGAIALLIDLYFTIIIGAGKLNMTLLKKFNNILKVKKHK